MRTDAAGRNERRNHKTDMRAIYTRLNAVRDIFAWDLESGASWLQEQENAGLLSAVGIYDEATKTLHVPEDRPEPFANGDGVTDYYGQLRALGIEIRKIDYYIVDEREN